MCLLHYNNFGLYWMLSSTSKDCHATNSVWVRRASGCCPASNSRRPAWTAVCEAAAAEAPSSAPFGRSAARPSGGSRAPHIVWHRWARIAASFDISAAGAQPAHFHCCCCCRLSTMIGSQWCSNWAATFKPVTVTSSRCQTFNQ